MGRAVIWLLIKFKFLILLHFINLTTLDSDFNETEIDESIITNWKGNAFLTYRTIFRDWTSTFVVEYLPDNISRDQVIELLQAMGFAGGIGAHRVGLKGGTNGKFHVEKVEMI